MSTAADGPPKAAGELERLRQQNEYKSQLLNSVAHEVATPLTPIRIQLLILRESVRPRLSEKEQRSFDIVERNVERLHGLVEDVLSVARLESDRFPLVMEATSINEIVAEAVAAFREPATKLGLTLEYHHANDVEILADQRRFIQVLHNIIGNAVKFTPEGGTIRVSTKVTDEDVVVDVTDTGIGFEPWDQDKLFKPFSQLPSPKSNAYHGSGLGLYISQGIVNLHGGQIWGVSPGRDRGASFGIRMPLASSSGITPARAIVRSTAGSKREEDFTKRLRSLI